MTSNFDCLGFSLKNEYEYDDLLRSTVANSEPLLTPSGGYLPWIFGNGIELWARMECSGQLSGLHPHFSGSTTQILRLFINFPYDEHPLDGVFAGWVNPAADFSCNPLEIGGEYPIIFASPAYEWFQNLPLPIVARVQLAAFALHLTVQDDTEDYQPLVMNGVSFPKEFFLPAGTFTVEGEKVPESFALFGGKVLSSKTVLNSFTLNQFVQATVRTAGLDMDIVIPLELSSRPLERGQILHGLFWMSGMILEILETFDEQTSIHRSRLFLQTQIAGMQYQVFEDGMLTSLRFGDRMQLKREPENPHDPNAIAVYSSEQVKLGYIPKMENYALAKFMDHGIQPIVHLVNKFTEPLDRLIIRIYLP